MAKPIPIITHGPISGEVTDTSAALWARGNLAGQIVFDISGQGEATPTTTFTQTDSNSDLTGRVHVQNLQPGTLYSYRVSLSVDGERSAPISGRFRTAPAPDAPAPLEFLFSSCIGGQGYCRDAEKGWTIFDTMSGRLADFMLLIGDTIYADTECPCPPNVSGAESPAADLPGFHARYRYHLEDPHYASFLARTPVYVTWDDHEIANDFSGPALMKSNPKLFRAGRQAFFDYWPLLGAPGDQYRIYRHVRYGSLAEFFILDTRTYRAPHVSQAGSPASHQSLSMLGQTQFNWLIQGLATSDALWKFVVTSVPLSYPTGWPRKDNEYDSWMGVTQAPGYESELSELLKLLNRNNLKNVVFLAGDTHWPYAINYDYDADGIPDFYEFGCSPLSAIPLEPVAAPDHTFNPTVLYAEGKFEGDLFNFGHISIASDGHLTFRVIDWKGKQRFDILLKPEG
jgi:alkaline phosphatase D